VSDSENNAKYLAHGGGGFVYIGESKCDAHAARYINLRHIPQRVATADICGPAVHGAHFGIVRFDLAA
jgi:hypothetical protein